MNRSGLVIATHVVSGLLGAVVGYYLAASFFDRRYSELTEAFDEELEDYKADAREGRKLRHQRETKDALFYELDREYDAARRALKTYSGNPDAEDDEEGREDEPLPDFPEVISIESTRVIISERDPDNPNKPYLIGVDLFLEEGSPYEKIQISYFEGDDVLCDNDYRLMQEVDSVIGSANLSRFGDCDPDDPHIIYVRNERIEADFKVCREEGSYSHVVLGLDEDELETKMETPRPKKMRQDV